VQCRASWGVIGKPSHNWRGLASGWWLWTGSEWVDWLTGECEIGRGWVWLINRDGTGEACVVVLGGARARGVDVSGRGTLGVCAPWSRLVITHAAFVISLMSSQSFGLCQRRKHGFWEIIAP
jgi:hypothetical protein